MLVKLSPVVLVGLALGCAPAGDSTAQSASSPAARPPGPTPTPADGPRLTFPLACTIGETCEIQNYVDRDPGPAAQDYRCGTNTYQAHGGVDVRLLDLKAQAAGVAVLAAAPGTVARLRDGVADISVKSRAPGAVDGQECGNGVVIDHGGGWETQYCHLARNSLIVRVGEPVTEGQPIAKVGLSGNTEYPHLHLTVRRDGKVVEPFAPNLPEAACDAGAPGAGLWTADAARAMSYKAGAVLNAGFAAGPVSMETIEAGGIAPPDKAAPALVAYIRAINLRQGDVQRLTIKGPDGAVVATGGQPGLDRAKAQYMTFVGRKAPAGGWLPGQYLAEYVVERGGKPAVTRKFSLRL